MRSSSVRVFALAVACIVAVLLVPGLAAAQESPVIVSGISSGEVTGTIQPGDTSATATFYIAPGTSLRGALSAPSAVTFGAHDTAGAMWSLGGDAVVGIDSWRLRPEQLVTVRVWTPTPAPAPLEWSLTWTSEPRADYVYQSITPKRTVVAYGASTTVTYRITEASGGYAAGIEGVGLPVALDRSANGSVWTTVTAGTASIGGNVTTVTPVGRTYVRMRSWLPGGEERVGYAVELNRYAKLGNPNAPATVRRNTGFTVTGSLLPKHAYKSAPITVKVYRLSGTGWRYVKSVPGVVGKTGSTWSARISLPTAGQHRMTASVKADSGHAATVSTVETLKCNPTKVTYKRVPYSGGRVPARKFEVRLIAGGTLLKRTSVILETSPDMHSWTSQGGVTIGSSGVGTVLLSGAARPPFKYVRFRFRGNSAGMPASSSVYTW